MAALAAAIRDAMLHTIHSKADSHHGSWAPSRLQRYCNGIDMLDLNFVTGRPGILFQHFQPQVNPFQLVKIVLYLRPDFILFEQQYAGISSAEILSFNIRLICSSEMPYPSMPECGAGWKADRAGIPVAGEWINLPGFNRPSSA
jgi:hypothetical protein